MAKRDKAVYAPGELGRLRERLGEFDRDEAQILAQKLGGEVGYERSDEQEKARQGSSRTRNERVNVQVKGRPRRSVELIPEYEAEEKPKKSFRVKKANPADDPKVLLKTPYWERIKMDKFAGQPEFEIKSSGQVLYSMISVFADIADSVSLAFVNRRMGEYYKKIELLVVSTRNMFPRNNARRNERVKKSAPTAYTILDVIRYWDIEKISNDLARIQANPKAARVSDFSEILRAVYKPLFILGDLDLDSHVRSAYKVLYKILYIENPMEAQNKYQDLIRTALSAYSGVYRDVHYLLYPLLLKTVSASYVDYDRFFQERKNRYMAFLGVTENDKIDPAVPVLQDETKEYKPGEEPNQGEASSGSGQAHIGGAGAAEVKELTEEEKAALAAEEAEKKALDRGLQTLELLFPQAGWNRLATFPDLYPYFAEMFDLKKGVVNIAPTDPMQQIFILMRVLEELFFGLRHISFSSVHGASGNLERIDTILGELVNNWRYYIELSFEKEYLPRLSEYVRLLEGSIEERNAPYTKKLITELHWIKRFYLLPFYKFESLVPPSIQKKDTVPIYAKIRTLRKYLTAVAAGIEQGSKSGGAAAHAPCDGIENPWVPYVFQVPNPLSVRMDALLSPRQKNNASLIFFCLAVTTVLDKLVNSEDSWAYGSRAGPLFRSINGEGILPLIGVDDKIDAEAMFKRSLKQREKKDPEEKLNQGN